VLVPCALCVVLSVPIAPAWFLGILRYTIVHVTCKAEGQDLAVSFSQQEK